MSFEIGRVKGIPIKIHFTLIITFLIFTWTISTHFMPYHIEGLSGVEYWILGSFATIILFASIILHELAHSLVSLRFGIPVRSIMLFIFGGVSDISKEPRDFKKEFKIAVAGPVTSFAIAGILAAVSLIFTYSQMTEQYQILAKVESVVYYGVFVNLLLGVFNLVPAFPLDGGRILRAGLVFWKKDYDEATKTSTSVGIGISYFFMVIGFVSLLTGNFIGGLWIILIGWFLHSGAQSYRQHFEMTYALKDIMMGKIMKKKIITIRKDATVQMAIEDYFKEYMKSEFPVVDENNNLVGVITLRNVMNMPKDEREITKVVEVIIPVSQLVIARSESKADSVFMKMIQKRQGKAFVCDEGRLVGLLSKTDIINITNEKQQYARNLKNL